MTSLPKNLVYAAASHLLLNFAAMAFVGVSIFLAWQANAWHSFLQLRGLAFVVGGLVISGGLIGTVSGRVHYSLAKIIFAHSENKTDDVRSAMIRWAGTAVLLAQLLLVYYLTATAFELWLLNPSG